MTHGIATSAFSRAFLKDYFERYKLAALDITITEQLIAVRDAVVNARDGGGKVVFAGNGASAAIASHCAVDYTKQGGVRSIAFNDADLITCFANDYGYEKWVAKAIEHWTDPEDVLVLISSSGRSENMLNAARSGRTAGQRVITCTGFERDNPLRQLGDINLWVNSRAYNIVECTHQFWLAAVCDMMIGRAEYAV